MRFSAGEERITSIVSFVYALQLTNQVLSCLHTASCQIIYTFVSEAKTSTASSQSSDIHTHDFITVNTIGEGDWEKENSILSS